ncbi:MAG TPA: aldo/keto reductase [Rhabdochlamydiaceae bacterium]|jgi:aryl-alcohol dehydrogenase-like predicted oxidoreductase
MHKRSLGNSELKIPPIVLGTWAIGGWMWGGTNEKDAVEAIQTSIDEGITAIDTAAVYGMGLSEELVGKAIQGRRDAVLIATKCGLRWNGHEQPSSLSEQDKAQLNVRRHLRPESIFWECEQSLKRLKIDAIDLYQIHWPDPSTPLEDSWNALMRLLEQGKVRAIGVCNYSLEQLREIHALYPVHSIQMPYSLIKRGAEEDIIPFCQNNTIAFLAYSPLERGLLSGKIGIDHRFPKGDSRAEDPLFSPQNRKCILALLEKLRPLAKRHNATLSQILINCTYHMPGVTAALVGARNAAQARENAQALSASLSEEERTHVLTVLSETFSEFS